MARTLLFSETFNGMDQNPLRDSAAWARASAFPSDVQRLSSVARAVTTNTQAGLRCETLVGANQYAKATGVNADGAAVAITGVCTRMQADGSCYALYFYPNDSGGSVSLYRFDSGSFSGQLLRLPTGGATTNVSIELRSIGSRHFAFLNGKYLGSYQDTTGGAYSTGKTGIAFLNNGTGATMAYFEMGTSDGLIDEFPNPSYDLFTGNEATLSEGGAWLIPSINAGTDATRHWVDGCQKADYIATGRGASQHDITYRSGVFTDAQYSSAVVDVGSFVGVVTRTKSNGDCYLAFQHSLNGDVELYRYRAVGDPGADPAEGFVPLTTAMFSPTGGVVLLELYSVGNLHNVWVTNPGGVRTNIIANFSDSSYPTGGAPGIAPFGSALNVYAWVGGNVGGACTISTLGVGHCATPVVTAALFLEWLRKRKNLLRSR